MSIEQTDVVDLIGIDKVTGAVVLTISDHLDWNDEDAHLLLLQEKINTYLRFIESGEINDTYPKAKGRNVLIEVVGKHEFSEAAEHFLTDATRVVEDAGFGLRSRRLTAQE